MRIIAWLLAAIACGGPMRPREVRASARGGAVEVSWRSNAADLLGQPDIDGALVGGASLKADDFARIIAAA